MEQLLVEMYFTKEVEKDNYFEGIVGGRWLTYEEHVQFIFTDKNDLISRLGSFLHDHFDIGLTAAIEGLQYDEVSKTFCYSQSEDGAACRMDITEKEPDGYCADYRFDVLKVFAHREIEYKF